MPMPTAPANMNDFMSQASSFVTNARQKGIDDNKIANTVKFMYGLTQENMKSAENNAITPYQQAQLDLEQQRLDKTGSGTWNYNSDTGQYYNNATAETKGVPNADTNISGSDFSMGSSPVQTATTTQKSPAKNAFDPEAFDQSWNPTPTQPTQNQMKQSSAPVQSSNWQDKYKSPVMGTMESIASGTMGTPWQPARYGT